MSHNSALKTQRAWDGGGAVAGAWKVRLARRRRELKPPQLDIKKLSLSEETLVPYNDEENRNALFWGKGPSSQRYQSRLTSTEYIIGHHPDPAFC